MYASSNNVDSKLLKLWPPGLILGSQEEFKVNIEIYWGTTVPWKIKIQGIVV